MGSRSLASREEAPMTHVEKDRFLGGLLGVAVGDALGVTVEFQSREELTLDPVKDMRGSSPPWYQPPGTWSDDSSLTFCLAESLTHGLNLDDVGKRFVA